LPHRCWSRPDPRLEVSENLAEQRQRSHQPEALNALILQRMRTGILVLDEQRRVQLANHSAKTCSRSRILKAI
jgi:two-component system sensor histidine kinase PilS (NtrC family)